MDSPHQLSGIGSTADILASDIAACGPSVVHVISEVLLPFVFNQTALDAITATQAPAAPDEVRAPASPGASSLRVVTAGR